MRKLYQFSLILLITFHPLYQALSQDIKIELGKGEIALNEPFTITIVLENETLSGYDAFPDIPGFIKRGTSSSSSTNIFSGNISRTQSVSQNYYAQDEGEYELKPFSMSINGKKINAPGKKIKVTPPQQRQQAQRYDPFSSDPFEEFFGRRSNPPKEFVDVKEDAFLALTVDKHEAYLGEGINATLAFYVAEENRAPLQFYDLSNQLTEIMKKISPASVWEENFNIERITPEAITINKKRYSMYRLYQATLFPLNTDDIEFPPVSMKMIKYKVAKNPTFFGQNRQEDFKTFTTKPVKVKIKDLPPHPLKDQVSVGNFKLNERISNTTGETGTSIEYQFQISGEGNIAGIKKPDVTTNDLFEIYPPNSQERINRSGNRVSGQKTYSYYLVPNEPGDYDLGDYFQWIYFDPSRVKYDTLKSGKRLIIHGESRKNEYISSRTPEGFYAMAEYEDNQLRKIGESNTYKLLINVFSALILVLTLAVLFKK